MIGRSSTVPVVVDFWAAWCAPCRALGPLLESAASAREGKVVLAKVDTDANPRLSQALGIQGIPAVKAYRDGLVVDEFVGVKPAPAVERFFDALVPSEADALVRAGDERSLRHALELAPGRPDAALALGRLLHERGDPAGALAVLDLAPGHFQVDGLAARIRLEAAVAGAPPDTSLAPAAAGLRALDGGEIERGLDLLLAELGKSEGDEREDLRRVIVATLDALGVEHPLARDARRRLAAALY